MMRKTIGFFLVPVACLDELRELDEYMWSGKDAWERFIRENQYFQRARDMALHRIELAVDKDEHSPLSDVMREMRYRAWRGDYERIFTPEECARRLHTLDAFEHHRGGRERVIQHIVGEKDLQRSEASIRAVYMLLCAMLERAHGEGVGLTWATLRPEAAAAAEAERREQREYEARRAQREREGKLDEPITWIEWDYERGRPVDAEPSDMDEAAFDRLIDETLWQRAVERSSPEPRQPDPERWPYQYPEVVVFPERFVPQVQAFKREALNIWETTGDAMASLVKRQEGDGLMLLEAHDEAKFRCLGEHGAWDVICVEAFGLEPCLEPDRHNGVQSMLFPAAETRAMTDALEQWIASLGGREATIEHIAARAIGRSRTMSETVYDTATRLLYLARERGAALAIIQSFRDD